ncbi:MAG: hypothetical protein NTV93_11020 [Verrucomicrobia bacterium]|nr:hypothetical protein [Verrucomicrobiota bacterium]
MTNPASPRPPKRPKSSGDPTLIRCGSVAVKIYKLRREKGAYFTVSWHTGPKRNRQNFKAFEAAKKFARDRAEELAAGQVNSPTVICTRDIEDWLCKRSTSLVTRNDFRRLIITLFNFARRRGYLPRDRETEARWLEKPKIKSKPIQIFSPQEIDELLAASEGQPRLAIALGAFTGIRSAAIFQSTPARSNSTPSG